MPKPKKKTKKTLTPGKSNAHKARSEFATGRSTSADFKKYPSKFGGLRPSRNVRHEGVFGGAEEQRLMARSRFEHSEVGSKRSIDAASSMVSSTKSSAKKKKRDKKKAKK